MAGGVTSIQALPGSANLIGGRGVTLHLRPQRGSRAMRFPGSPDGLKMACGENPKRVYGEKPGGPSTRMGNLRGQRDAFMRAERYIDEWNRYLERKALNDEGEWVEDLEDDSENKENGEKRRDRGGPPQPPRRDLELETLAQVLAGDILVHWHCYRADDMLSALQLAEEFGFHVRSFHHALESYKIRDVLAELDVASSTWDDWWGFKLEAYDGIEENAALADRGRCPGDHPLRLGDRHPALESRSRQGVLRRPGIGNRNDRGPGVALGHGESRLGVGDRGSKSDTLEVGKRADLVVWERPPVQCLRSSRGGSSSTACWFTTASARRCAVERLRGGPRRGLARPDGGWAMISPRDPNPSTACVDRDSSWSCRWYRPRFHSPFRRRTTAAPR